jgi:PAS domain S-box-containing protein
MVGITRAGATNADRDVCSRGGERFADVRAMAGKHTGKIPRPATPPHLAGLEPSMLAAIIQGCDDAIASKTLDGIVTSWNHSAERLFGYTAEEMIGRHISILAAPGREPEMPRILERIRQGLRVEHFETVRRRKDGSLIEISLTVSPIRNSEGHLVGASKIARDISDRRQLEREREMRIRELQHRIKNLLGMVMALAHQTAAPDSSAQNYRDSFLGRVAALTVAHQAAFDAHSEPDLALLARQLLAPYTPADRPTAVSVEGPSAVRLRREKVQSLAFILHELATNAVKHGCLAESAGTLQLTWQLVDQSGSPWLHLHWVERCTKPGRGMGAHGFGLTFIEYAAIHELGGSAELSFEVEGLVAQIRCPIG